MAHDLVIRNGEVIDGTGAARFRADVAVSNGRIDAVGSVPDTGARELDASGRAVAPGFLDIHTHYDAQLCWDGLATPSPQHGVTTVVTGNCSLSLAPVRDDGPKRMVGMFQTIEDIREPTFDAAVPWSWESFPEYLDFLRGGLGVHLSPLIGHSALRLYTMGADSQKRTATDAEIATMVELVHEAVAAGGHGLSLSHLDVDENLVPVPSRWSDHREKLALARAVVEAGGHVLETVPGNDGSQRELLAELGEISRETGITCTIQPVLYYPPAGDSWKHTLDALAEEAALGGRVYGQCAPRPFDMNLRLDETFFSFFLVPSWGEVMSRPAGERAALLADPARRPKLVEEGLPLLSLFLDNAWIGDTVSSENRPLAGRRLTDIAAERGTTVVDVLIDVGLADDLGTEFQIRGAMHADPDITAEILRHPQVIVGASDGGAHLSQFCGAGDTTYLLSKFVRERNDFTLEEGVHQITGRLADLWAIEGRGEIREGLAADLVVFDPATVGQTEETYHKDVPGNANRYLRDATGIDTVLVAGETVVQNNQYTNARPGQVL